MDETLNEIQSKTCPRDWATFRLKKGVFIHNGKKVVIK